jgi:restriction system protein
MPIPTYDHIMLPLLQCVQDGEEYHIRQVREALAEYYDLTEDEYNRLLPSGNQAIFANRVGWAKTYLAKAGLLDTPKRGYLKINQRGHDVLASNPSYIDRNLLLQFEDFAEFQNKNNDTNPDTHTISQQEEIASTPDEIIEINYQRYRKSLASELLETVLSVSPSYFERLVIDLLLAMGYGSSLESGFTVGKSGDGGVDGYIYEDKLGLDTIYVQAKRWAIGNNIGSSVVREFVGTLATHGASKGVFITTSDFTADAKYVVERVPNTKIILINGEMLARLMIEHNVGVDTRKVYTIKQVDENYFADT